jgi:hypothetical protein
MHRHHLIRPAHALALLSTRCCGSPLQPARKSLPKGDIAQEHVLLAYYKMWDTHGVSPQILIPESGHFR